MVLNQEKRFYAKDEDNVRQVVLQRDTGQLRHSTQVKLRSLRKGTGLSIWSKTIFC